MAIPSLGEEMSFGLREASFERQNLKPSAWLLSFDFRNSLLESRFWNPYLAQARHRGPPLTPSPTRVAA